MKNDEKLTPNTQHTESINVFELVDLVLDLLMNQPFPGLAFFTNLVSQASSVDLNGPLRQVTVVACSDGWKPHDILLRAMHFDDAPLCLLTS